MQGVLYLGVLGIVEGVCGDIRSIRKCICKLAYGGYLGYGDSVGGTLGAIWSYLWSTTGSAYSYIEGWGLLVNIWGLEGV